MPAPRTQALLALALLVATPGPLRAQDADAQALAHRAQREEAAGNHREAAAGYAAAYAARASETDYAAEAARLFELTGDLPRAAELYAVVAPLIDEHPRAGLRLARALRRLQRSDEASAALVAYRDAYAGQDRAAVLGLVAREAEGLSLARAESAVPPGRRRVVPFTAEVNGPGYQSAPMPLAPGAVYYLTDAAGGRPGVWRAAPAGDTWGGAEPAAQFPSAPGGTLGVGTLSPTGDRFYLGLCAPNSRVGDPTAPCRLHVIDRAADGTWGRPVALPEYVNLPGFTATHPYAYREGDREVLLFASDRPGGRGGTDLYRTERELTSDANDFTFPVNLGDRVNGPANEIAPSFDASAGRLHFASDDGGGLGGYDIYAADALAGGDWSAPTNALAPLNSPADDYFYRALPDGSAAVMASNRPLPGDTSLAPGDDNLYAVLAPAPTTPVAVSVLDSVSGRGVAAVTLEVFDGDRLLTRATGDDGYFRLELPLDARLVLVATAPDYRPRRVRARTPAQPSRSFQLPPMQLRPAEFSLVEVQRIEAERSGTPAELVAAEVAPAAPDTTFRIQVAARRGFAPDELHYAPLARIGAVRTQHAAREGLHRVFVGDFPSAAAAAAQLARVGAAGWPGAFVVGFVGERYAGPVERPR